MTRDAAIIWEQLQTGNEHYVLGTPEYPHQDGARRESLASGQHPDAAVLSCADSRVAPELLFDCGLGDMFVVRIAGNIVTDEVLGSLEYAVAVLEVPLLIVLGHTCCGAVTAAVEQHETPGHIGSLTTNINQALEGLDLSGDGRMQTAICANVQDGVDRLQNSEPILAPLVQAGTLTVMGAFYDVATGRVTAIDEG